jgi:hypothetical protein
MNATRTTLTAVGVIAIVFYIAMRVSSREWPFATSAATQPLAPIIKGPKYNEVLPQKDRWLGTVIIEPSFLGERRFRDCGPRCGPEEIDIDGYPLPYSKERNEEDPLCSKPIFSPETFDMEFAKNEIRAEAVYGTGCWRLSGRIAEIDTSFTGGARFQLYGPTGTSIQCHVPEAYMSQFIDLNSGDQVLIKARGPSRILGGVVFSLCKL